MRWCWREGDGFSRFVFFRGRILPNLKCGGFINNQHEDLDRVGYISCINGGSLLMISTLWPSTGISPSWSCGRSRKFIGKVGHSEKRHLDCSRWCRYKRPVMLLFYIPSTDEFLLCLMNAFDNGRQVVCKTTGQQMAWKIGRAIRCKIISSVFGLHAV